MSRDSGQQKEAKIMRRIMLQNPYPKGLGYSNSWSHDPDPFKFQSQDAKTVIPQACLGFRQNFEAAEAPYAKMKVIKNQLFPHFIFSGEACCWCLSRIFFGEALSPGVAWGWPPSVCLAPFQSFTPFCLRLYFWLV